MQMQFHAKMSIESVLRRLFSINTASAMPLFPLWFKHTHFMPGLNKQARMQKDGFARQENCTKTSFSLALALRLQENRALFFLVCQLGMQQGRQRVREREFVKAQSGSLASLFQIPEVFSALESLELIWLSGFPL